MRSSPSRAICSPPPSEMATRTEVRAPMAAAAVSESREDASDHDANLKKVGGSDVMLNGMAPEQARPAWQVKPGSVRRTT